MRRSALLLTALVALGACRTYQTYPRLSDQDGLMPADAYAGYDQEAAQKVAIGRKFAELFTGTETAQRKAQADAAVAFAKTQPDVVDVKADTLGFWLTVTFKSGWRVAVSPVKDGVKAEETKGLPAGKK